MKEKRIEKDIKRWRDSENYTILMVASWNGRLNILKWLLEEVKFDVNERNSYFQTAFHCAAYNKQVECARLLLKHGATLYNFNLAMVPL